MLLADNTAAVVTYCVTKIIKRVFTNDRAVFFDNMIVASSDRVVLRLPASKNKTNSQYRGKRSKIWFGSYFMVDRLMHDKNYWIVFLAKYSFISKKCANYQFPLKSPFYAPFYKTGLRVRMQNHISFPSLKHSNMFAMFKFELGWF